MIENLRKKLEQLSEKFNNDSDIISLKALCSVPKNEETLFAIEEISKRLKEKYPDDEEIIWLFSDKEVLSLEELIEILEERYPNNAEIVTIKSLLTLPEDENRYNSINQCLKRLSDEKPTDENIKEYLSNVERVAKLKAIVENPEGIVKDAFKEVGKDLKDKLEEKLCIFGDDPKGRELNNHMSNIIGCFFNWMK